MRKTLHTDTPFRARDRAASLVFLLALSLVATHSAAQTPARSFSELQLTLKTGQRVLIVRDNQMGNTTGRVVSITSSQIEIEHSERAFIFKNTQRFTVGSAFIRTIYDDDATWNGLLVGGATGVALATAVLRKPGEKGKLLCFLLCVPLGLGLGHSIDKDIHRRLYERPTAMVFTLAPMVDRSSIGAVVRWDF